MDVASKVTGSQWTAAEQMEIVNELENSITDSGQSLSSGDVFQVSKAMSIYAAGGDYYTDSGAADAYILSIIGSKKAPAAYFNGMRIRFRTSNANTGASTVNVASLGVKNIKLANGSSDPLAGDIGTASDVEAVYDGTSFRLLNIQFERFAVTGTSEFNGVVTIDTVAGDPLVVDSAGNSQIDWQISGVSKWKCGVPLGGTQFTIYDVVGDQAALGLLTDAAASGVGIGATGKFYLDGTLCTGNTYIHEVSSDKIQFIAGGNNRLEIQANYLFGTEGIRIGTDNTNSHINDSSSGAGTTTMYIGNASINVTSDKRLKYNITDTKINAIDLINKFRVVDHSWNDPNDKCINNRNARGIWTSLIAQEAVDVLPFIVNAPRPEGKEIDYDSEDIWHIEYDKLVPVLIKAFQQQDLKIKLLEEKING